jgi:hypothetical protein
MAPGGEMASGGEVSFLFSINIKLAIQVDRSSDSASFSTTKSHYERRRS